MSARRSIAPATLLALAVIIGGCGGSDLTLDYQLDGIAPADVVRVETRVDVASADPREFYADQPYREIATGVGYEVRDVDGTGKRTLLVTHDATLGYVFSPRFQFRLRPPVSGSAPPLSIVARAVGVSDAIGETAPLAATFGHDRQLAVVISDQRCDGQSCDANQLCCVGIGCVSVQTDVANCGSCGQACAPSGDSCSGAACRCAGGSACTDGQSCCAGLGCVDLQSDPFHCGTCDHACNPGESCSAGVCGCGSGAACTGTSPLCCADGCSSIGSCTCSVMGGRCAYPDVCCAGDQCADLATDDANCGACGLACSAPLSCADGACSCHGLICVAGNDCCASGCANLANDPNNCGACGVQCAANETCGLGPSGTPTCVCGANICGDGELCCGGACVKSSSSDCGSCDHACKQGESCSTAGACSCNGGNACVGNQICCAAGATTNSAGCFDPSSDPNHCGDCATVCPSGKACVTGQCVPTPCDPPCSNGNTCVGGTCQCDGAKACGSGQTCCADGCHDLSSDAANCNLCGHVCATGDYCCQGACTAPSNDNCTGCGLTCTKCCTCQGAGSCPVGGLCLCL